MQYRAIRRPLACVGLAVVVFILAAQHGVFAHRAHWGTGCSDSAYELTVAQAFQDHRRHIEVCDGGVVTRVLKDDLVGPRHQRFIVRVGHLDTEEAATVLIAYNIDLAPRIENLQPGEPVEFSGEYEWNGQGGIVHWTHQDPSGEHPAGWIRYEGHVYR